MGIKDFLRFGKWVDGIMSLDMCIEHFHRNEFRYPTIGFDMSVLFHHFIQGFEAKLVHEIMSKDDYGTTPDSLVKKEILKGYLQDLHTYLDGRKFTHAYLVFDGPGIPYKEKTMEKRRKERKEAYENEHFGCAVETPVEHASIVQQFIDEEFTSKAIDKPWTVIMSPCEADAQLYELQREGLVDIIVTVDSDVIAYGSKRVFLTRPPRYFIKEDIDEHPKEYTIPQELVLNTLPSDIMVLLAWFLENDYTKGISGIGWKTISKYISGITLDLSKNPLEVAQQLISKMKEVNNEKSTFVKATTKMGITVDELFNQLLILFKIFKTYPVLNIRESKYTTLNGVKLETVNDCKLLWRKVEPELVLTNMYLKMERNDNYGEKEIFMDSEDIAYNEENNELWNDLDFITIKDIGSERIHPKITSKKKSDESKPKKVKSENDKIDEVKDVNEWIAEKMKSKQLVQN